MKKNRKPSNVQTPEARAQAVQAHLNGESQNSIAKRLNVNSSAVGQWVRKHRRTAYAVKVERKPFRLVDHDHAKPEAPPAPNALQVFKTVVDLLHPLGSEDRLRVFAALELFLK